MRERENFSWITDQLAVGESPTRRKLEELKNESVTGIVDIRSEASDDQDFLQALGLVYLHIDVDDCYAPTVDQVVRIYEFVDPLLENGKKVFVHCQNGYGRSPLVIAAILIHRGMDTQEAMGLLYERHPVTTLMPSQRNFILYLEEELNNL